MLKLPSLLTGYDHASMGKIEKQVREQLLRATNRTEVIDSAVATTDGTRLKRGFLRSYQW